MTSSCRSSKLFSKKTCLLDPLTTVYKDLHLPPLIISISIIKSSHKSQVDGKLSNQTTFGQSQRWSLLRDFTIFLSHNRNSEYFDHILYDLWKNECTTYLGVLPVLMTGRGSSGDSKILL